MDAFGNKRVPNPPPNNGTGFNNYAAGKKHYGGGRSMPNIGPVGDLLGYAIRDRKKQTLQRTALQNAIARRLKAQDSGNPMAFDYLNYLGGGSS